MAIAFLVRDKSKSGQCQIRYASREDAELARDKLAYLAQANPHDIAFESITPDARNNWLNQSDSEFEKLLPVAGRETKFAKTVYDEQAVFRLYANAAKSNRDEWVYDFDVANLRAKALFFADRYNEILSDGGEPVDPSIKWSRDLRNEFRRGRRIVYNDGNRIFSLYRPFASGFHHQRCSNGQPL